MSAFMPPAPLTIDAYLDDVTRGKVARLTNVYWMDVEGALACIKQRANVEERTALLSALAKRLNNFGEAKGYIGNVPKHESNQLVLFIAEDILGLDLGRVDEVVAKKLTKALGEFVKEGLNAKGKKAFEFLKVIYDLISCETSGEAARILGKVGTDSLIEWMKHNAPLLATSAMKRIGIKQAVRNRILRVLALRTVWLRAVPKLVARLDVVLTGLEILLSPEETASDFQEQKLAFYAHYGRVVAEQNSIFSDLIKTDQVRMGHTPLLKYPLHHVLSVGVATSP